MHDLKSSRELMTKNVFPKLRRFYYKNYIQANTNATDITIEVCFEDQLWLYSDSEKCGARGDRIQWLIDGIELYLEQELVEARVGNEDRTPQEARPVFQHLPAFNQLRSKGGLGAAGGGGGDDGASLSDDRHAKQMQKLLNGYEKKQFH